MKIIIPFILLITTTACTSEQNNFDHELTDHYHKLHGQHMAELKSVPELPILFLGDSLTEAMPITNITDRGVNYGISQDTTYGLKLRVEDYPHLANAEAIFICIGINDFWRGRDNEGILKNIKAIIQQLPNDKPVFLNGLLPVDEVERWIGWPKRIQLLNQKLAGLAEQQGVYFIDAHPKMAEANGFLKASYHNGDGVHLSEQGYKVWTDIIREAMAQQQVSL